MKKIFVLLLSMLLLLSGCSTEKNEASTRYLTTMDTVMTLTAYGPHREQGLDLAQAEIENLNSLLSTGLPGSEISRLNQAGAASLSQEPLALLERQVQRLEKGALLGVGAELHPAAAELGEQVVAFSRRRRLAFGGRAAGGSFAFSHGNHSVV